MWIEFVKHARANERAYEKGDKALFQNALGQKLIDDGFAKLYDPAEDVKEAEPEAVVSKPVPVVAEIEEVEEPEFVEPVKKKATKK